MLGDTLGDTLGGVMVIKNENGWSALEDDVNSPAPRRVKPERSLCLFMLHRFPL